MSKNLKALVVVLLFLLMSPSAVFAVPASPDSVEFKQANGETILVSTYGDEFLNWSEDINGNLIEFENGDYYYATWADEGPVATSSLVTNNSTYKTSSIASKGSDIPEAVLDRAVQLHEEMMPEIQLDNSLIQALSGSIGPVINSNLQRNTFVIHVLWDDNEGLEDLTPLTQEQISDIVFTGNKSVNAYFTETFQSADDIIIPANGGNIPANGILEVTLEGKHPFDNETSTNLSATTVIFKDALSAAILEHNIDLSSFDTNEDNIIQFEELSICFVVHGYEASGSVPDGKPAFWGCATYYRSVEGFLIEGYSGLGAYHYKSDGSIPFTIGVFCHEFGHSAYGFDDMYDTGSTYDPIKGRALGRWSLMSSGSWNAVGSNPGGSSPAYPDAYNLVSKNIVTPRESYADFSEEHQTSTAMDIYKVNTNDPTGKQYFLLQQRRYEGFDMGTFRVYDSPNSETGGLLIYHVDENAPNNAKNKHLRCAIEEAHGGHDDFDVEWNFDGVNDMFGNEFDSFTSTTNPSSALYSEFTRDNISPTKIEPSGVNIENIVWDSSTKKASFKIILDITNAADPVIDTQPIGGTYVTGDSATLNVEAHSPDEGVLTYQWYSYPVGSADDTKIAIPGANEATYIIDTAEVDTIGKNYYVEITNTLSTPLGKTSASIMSESCIVVINNRLIPIITNSGNLDVALMGIEYSARIQSLNDPTSFEIASGRLPKGLNLNNEGIISGIPVAAGTSSFSIIAANSGGESAAVEFKIAVSAVPIFTDGQGNVINELSSEILNVFLPFENTSNAPLSLTMMVAVYTPEGILCDYSQVTVDIASSDVGNLELNLDLLGNDDGVYASYGCYANVMVYDSNFAPMCQKYIFGK